MIFLKINWPNLMQVIKHKGISWFLWQIDMEVHIAAQLLEGQDWCMAPLAKYWGPSPPRIDAPAYGRSGSPSIDICCIVSPSQTILLLCQVHWQSLVVNRTWVECEQHNLCSTIHPFLNAPSTGSGSMLHSCSAAPLNALVADTYSSSANTWFDMENNGICKT